MKRWLLLLFVVGTLATFGMADPVAPLTGNQTEGNLKLSWEIVKQVGGEYDGWWLYTYTVSRIQIGGPDYPALSHFRLEVTLDFFQYVIVSGIGTVTVGEGKDGVFPPFDAWIKFDGVSGEGPWTFSFLSPNSPVYGGAFAKAGRQEETFIQITRPNGIPVPEPGSLALLGLGLLASGFVWRHRR